NLHSFLNARATSDGGYEMTDQEYADIRGELLASHAIQHIVPKFVKDVRTPKQFWTFIKSKFSTYAERRAFLDREFQPLQDYLEFGAGKAIVASASEALRTQGTDYIHSEWEKALARKRDD